MDAKSPFNIEYNQIEKLNQILLKTEKSFERLMAVSEYYFPLMEEAGQNKMSLEIKYLAVVESALN
jgi:membrane-bound lytic murein transglycosylase D